MLIEKTRRLQILQLSLYNLKPNPFQQDSCITETCTRFSSLLHLSQAAFMNLTLSFSLMKTEHVLQGILELNDTETTTAGYKR